LDLNVDDGVGCLPVASKISPEVTNMSCFEYQNELLANPFLAFSERQGRIASLR
jgi:hypothetical protein